MNPLTNFLLLCGLGICCSATARGSSERPHPLQRRSASGYHRGPGKSGHPDAELLDRLCRRGMAFNRAYMQGGFNGATCIPSRAMLMSGRPLFHVDEKLLDDETWPAAFGRSGYATFATGKWHNGAKSLAASFQTARSIFSGGMANPMEAPLGNLENGLLTKPVKSNQHACAVFADEAIRFLQQPRENPFLCYVAFDGPHDPHIVPDRLSRSAMKRTPGSCRRTSCPSIRSTTAS